MIPRFLKSCWFLMLGFLIAITTLIPFGSFAYDEQAQTKVAYYGGQESSVGYDAGPVLSTREGKNRTTENNVPLSKFTEFLAADTGVSQVLQNAANGRAFEQQGLNYLQTVNSDVAGQVSIRPFTASGDLANFRVRLDALGTDNAGTVNLYDFKSSASAGFTPNQQVGYPLLNQFGGQVVGGNGGLAYPAGMVIPPTPVTVLRPGGF